MNPLEIHRKNILQAARVMGEEALLLEDDMPLAEVNSCVHIMAKMLDAVFLASDPPAPTRWRKYLVQEAMNVMEERRNDPLIRPQSKGE
jgi:hypothetical protein